MDTIEHYRQFILGILDEYSKLEMFGGAVRFYKVVDQENDRYLLMSDGWWNKDHRGNNFRVLTTPASSSGR